MSSVRAYRKSKRGFQRGSVLVLLLLFGIPVIWLAYVGLVIEPGIKLVNYRIEQHQVDDHALALRYGCDLIEPCRQPELSSDPPPAPDNDCQPPDCGYVHTGDDPEYQCGEDELDSTKVYVTVEAKDEDGKRLGCATATMDEQDSDDQQQSGIDDLTDAADGIVGCKKVEVEGSGNIESLTGEDLLVYSTNGEDEIKLSGGSRVGGDIESTGKLTIEGGARATGKLYAEDELKIEGGASSGGGGWPEIITGGKLQYKTNEDILGDVKVGGDEAKFDNGGKVDVGGDVAVEGKFIADREIDIKGHLDVNEDIELKNKKSTVEGAVRYGGSCDDGKKGTVCKKATNENPRYDFDVSDRLKRRPCDPLGLNALFARFNNSEVAVNDLKFDLGWYAREWRLTPERLEYFDNRWDQKTWVTYSDAEVVDGYLKVKDFELPGSDNELSVDGGDIVLHVTGDFKIKGNSNLIICSKDDESEKCPEDDSDATLVLLVEGDVDIEGSGNISTKLEQKQSITPDNRLQLALLSKGDVKLSGANRTLYGLIYAPRGDVNIEGSRQVNGAVRAEELKVSGSGEILYEPGLKLIDGSDDSDGDDPGGAGKSRKPYLVE